MAPQATEIMGSGDIGVAPASHGLADPRLKPAAHEFEACLMKEFLEPLQHHPLFDEQEDQSSDEGSGNALMSFGSEALARAISERGGFGIAAKIIGQFDHGKGKFGVGEGGASEPFLRMG
jgi:peptidoglycan hydrolase FlgJ